MLALAGYVIDRVDNDRRPSDGERVNAIRQGRHALKRLTGVDFGYDLKAWSDHLLAGDFGYNHPYARQKVKRAIEQAIQDQDRTRLLALLAAKERGERGDSTATFIPG